MPYSKWSDVNDALKGIKPRLSLSQANLIAKWADAMAASPDPPEAPWGAALARFKTLYRVEGGVWVKRKETEASETKEFLFVEATTQAVEFLRLGTFRASNGRMVTITEGILETIVNNFNAKTAGQDVPIDIDHARGRAAGWVREVWRDGARLLASVDWNQIGEDLIGGQVYRYLSATIDSTGEILKSISLVNFPAVKGLQPVQLKEGGYTMDKTDTSLANRLLEAIRGVLGGLKMGGDPDSAENRLIIPDHTLTDLTEEGKVTDKEREDLREAVRQELLTEMKTEAKTRADLRTEVRAEVMIELREELDHQKELTQFAEKICGGDKGLSMEPEALVGLMVNLEDAQLKVFQAALTSKVVNFSELGSSRGGQAGRIGLDAVYKGQIQEWLDAGRKLDEWFELNADVVGSAEQYDLTEFDKKEE